MDQKLLDIAAVIVAGAGVYLAVGAVFALVWITVLAGRVDPGAKGAGIGFRLIIAPAAVLLWPVLLLRLARRP